VRAYAAAVRIIAGSRKGHRIAAPRGAQTRPTGERAREALFSMLGPLEDAAVLDLYAGSGALGLEALSRGARRCVFVDSNRASCRAVEQNLARLELTGALILCREVLDVVREEARAGRRYDLVFADPPYGTWREREPRYAELLPSVLADTGALAVETDARTQPDLPLELVTSRRYGAARITIFRR
jgi:16S rRNA (guanine966-N2)-methyltransferase